MRLIDADALKEHISSYAGMFTDEGFMVNLQAVLNGIDFAPTIDAVPVVRCKDCKHFMSDICYFDMGLHFCRGDDFCSYGERKE